MKFLVLINDQPYGSERPYNALRLAHALAKQQDVELRVYLMGDAVGCAVAGQEPPDGYYNLGRMVRAVASRADGVGCCGTCLDARAIGEERLVPGARRSSLEELAQWTVWADKVITY